MATEDRGLVGGLAVHQYFKNEMAKRIGDVIVFERMIGLRPKPTRWQRFKWRMADYGDRLTNAWLALRGEWPDE